MDFTPQPVLTGWSPKWHEWSYFHRHCEAGLSGNVYCRKKRGLFLLLGWSVFLVTTDCPDLGTGLTRKTAPACLGPTQLFKHHIWADTTSGRCWSISTWYFRSFKTYLY